MTTEAINEWGSVTCVTDTVRESLGENLRNVLIVEWRAQIGARGLVEMSPPNLEWRWVTDQRWDYCTMPKDEKHWHAVVVGQVA